MTRQRSSARKARLDWLLVERELAESRAKARSLVMAGLVYSEGRRLEKPGSAVDVDIPLEVRGAEHPWVSRGGVKLDYALDRFGVDVRGTVALDIGAATGGFTDVLLARGARRVYAVDVGYGQLAWRLRNDPRVVVLERTNARYLGREQVPEEVDIIVCDVSFIGLRTVLPAPLKLAAPGARLAALIKPQFEVGPEKVGKGGIVRDPALHAEVCETIRGWLEQAGWRVMGVAMSPIKGADGNVEFLIAAALFGRPSRLDLIKRSADSADFIPHDDCSDICSISALTLPRN